ncbi:MAG: ATP-dependent Clp protease proteolytic subunit [Proteobacteria bacterium]|nr:ATP-dependent Clp protease proteolytic subunit [Pseudomonadota bacterium]
MSTNKDSHFFSPMEEILFEQRYVQVSGPVGSKLALETNRMLLALDKLSDSKPIYLFIDSPGGEINSGFAIFDTVRFIKAPVYTIVAGLAASMGSIIALSAKKERRFALPNSKLLIHQPLISGYLQGPASDLEIHAEDIVKTREKINQLYALETGRSVEEIAKLTDRDKWLTPQEALDLGLICKIIKSKSELV